MSATEAIFTALALKMDADKRKTPTRTPPPPKKKKRLDMNLAVAEALNPQYTQPNLRLALISSPTKVPFKAK